MIERLNRYVDRGEFVRNPQLGAGRGHFIRDDRGRLCPLAWIIQDSGASELVDRLAESDNLVRVADTHAGPLMDWILESGLTREECILIQEPSLEFDERIATRERIAIRLTNVAEQLRRETEASLEVVLARLLERRSS